MNPILGIDFGRARIGVAISDELRLLAHPLATIPSNTSSLDRIAQIAREKKVDAVVVGVPRNMSGEIGSAARETMEFAKKLRSILSCEVVEWDERLTTVAAQRVLREAGKKTRASRSYVDQIAALMILQGYLDRRQHEAEPAQDATR